MALGIFETHDGLALAELVAQNQITPTELLDEAITCVEAADEKLSLLASRDYDFARQQIANGLPDGPFTGVPFLRKDQGADIEGLKSTVGMKLLQGNIATQTSTMAQRYLNAGLVIFGATKTPPFCVTIDTDRSHYGACKNPWDVTRTPGGSSSGAAAVVGNGTLPMAHGNDGGGSLRVPAAWCGAFTMKPSRGRLPSGPVYTEGWMGFATEGTITRSVRDCAAMMDATMGRELGARYDAPQPARPYLDETRHECRPLRIAMMDKTYAGRDFHPDYQTAMQQSAKLLRDLGHQVEIASPDIDFNTLSKELYETVAVDIKNVLDDIGAARGQAVNDEELEVIVRMLRRRGPKMTGSGYARINDMSMRTAFACDAFMVDYDALLSPTTPEPAVKIGEIFTHEADFEAFRAHQDRYLNLTMVQNVTGQPAMSVPLMQGPDGLPIGMMFTGRYGDESILFSLAAQLEQACPWWDRKPDRADLRT